MRPMYYRRDGTPYPEGEKGLFEWAKDFGDIKKKGVARDILQNGVTVSTVWLGLDHNLGGGNNRPLIFETMMFVPQKKEVNFLGRKLKFDHEEIGEQWRYSTEEEALRGHRMLVKKWSRFKTADQVLKA